MSRKKNTHAPVTYCVADFCKAMETIAPTSLAQDWDNVGLLAGDECANIDRVMCCIDLTSVVVEEAVQEQVDLVMAYHPPLFQPITTLHAQSDSTEAMVFQCIRSGIAIYSTHTALDAAEGGTNDVLASMCGIEKTEPLEFVDKPESKEFKLVVFVPIDDVEKIADAMFGAGAGDIGDYSHCSYRVTGQGTFLGGESTKPALGQKGKMEFVDEIRLETIIPAKRLPAVVQAMIETHSYEEPAYDIYSLAASPIRGIGRVGSLPHPVKLKQLADQLKNTTNANAVQIVGEADQTVNRAVIVAGAAGSLVFRVPLFNQDVIVTGEIRHHDALTIRRKGCNAIALGHWSSEQPTLKLLADRLESMLPGLAMLISNADADPFRMV